MDTFKTKEGASMDLKHGDRITWTQYGYDSASERSGTIWDRGPRVPGASMTWWVLPDVAEDDDVYRLVPVGKASSMTGNSCGTTRRGGHYSWYVESARPKQGITVLARVAQEAALNHNSGLIPGSIACVACACSGVGADGRFRCNECDGNTYVTVSSC